MKLIKLLLYSVIIALFSSCEKNISACFNMSTSTALVGQAVTFSDCSTGGGLLDKSTPAKWSWDFGDGTILTGNPVSHSYSSPGNYSVTLTVNDADGDEQGFTSQSVTISYPPGSLTFWTDQSYPTFSVTVDGINGSYSANVSGYYSSVPACGAVNCANLTIPEGQYDYSAVSGFTIWNGSITVVPNQCTTVLLH
jgi:PKD repeat protein